MRWITCLICFVYAIMTQSCAQDNKITLLAINSPPKINVATSKTNEKTKICFEVDRVTIGGAKEIRKCIEQNLSDKSGVSAVLVEIHKDSLSELTAPPSVDNHTKVPPNTMSDPREGQYTQDGYNWAFNWLVVPSYVGNYGTPHSHEPLGYQPQWNLNPVYNQEGHSLYDPSNIVNISEEPRNDSSWKTTTDDFYNTSIWDYPSPNKKTSKSSLIKREASTVDDGNKIKYEKSPKILLASLPGPMVIPIKGILKLPSDMLHKYNPAQQTLKQKDDYTIIPAASDNVEVSKIQRVQHSVHLPPDRYGKFRAITAAPVPNPTSNSISSTNDFMYTKPVAYPIPTPESVLEYRSSAPVIPDPAAEKGSSPGTSSSTPAKSNPAPDTSSSAPGTSTTAPDPSSSAPDTSSSAPDTSSSAPDTSSSAPDTSSSAPDPSSSAPDTSSSAPDPSSSEPGTSTPAPDPSSSSPGSSTPAPDPSSSAPDTSSSTPGASSPSCEPSSSTSEPSSPASETSSPPSDTPSPTPDTRSATCCSLFPDDSSLSDTCCGNPAPVATAQLPGPVSCDSVQSPTLPSKSPDRIPDKITSQQMSNDEEYWRPRWAPPSFLRHYPLFQRYMQNTGSWR